jgi:hypothetical protein
MNHDENRCSTRLRAAMLAFTAGILLLTAACGGSPSSTGSGGTSGTGGSSQSQLLAFAQCMRSHGVADFPDPSATGGFGSAGRSAQSNPDFGTASRACKHLLPNGGNKLSQGNESQLLHIAQCMRSHGVPNYPDPNPGVDPRTAMNQAGVDPNSPQFQAAARTCDQLYPLPSAGAGKGGGS